MCKKGGKSILKCVLFLFLLVIFVSFASLMPVHAQTIQEMLDTVKGISASSTINLELNKGTTEFEMIFSWPEIKGTTYYQLKIKDLNTKKSEYVYNLKSNNGKYKVIDGHDYTVYVLAYLYGDAHNSVGWTEDQYFKADKTKTSIVLKAPADYFGPATEAAKNKISSMLEEVRNSEYSGYAEHSAYGFPVKEFYSWVDLLIEKTDTAKLYKKRYSPHKFTFTLQDDMIFLYSSWYSKEIVRLNFKFKDEDDFIIKNVKENIKFNELTNSFEFKNYLTKQDAGIYKDSFKIADKVDAEYKKQGDVLLKVQKNPSVDQEVDVVVEDPSSSGSVKVIAETEKGPSTITLSEYPELKGVFKGKFKFKKQTTASTPTGGFFWNTMTGFFSVLTGWQTADTVDIGYDPTLSVSYKGLVVTTTVQGLQVCGDSVVEGTEVCEAGNTGDQTCETKGFAAGTLSCSNDCKSFDTSLCLTKTQLAQLNKQPQFTTEPILVAKEDAEYKYIVQAKDENEKDTLSISLVQGPQKMSLVDHGNGQATITWLPLNEDVGEHEVSISVTDNLGYETSTNTQKFTLIAENENDAPLIYPLLDETLTQERILQEDTVYDMNPFIVNDIDEGDVLSYSVTGPEWLSIDQSGKLKGTPSNKDVGEHEITYTVKDSSGEETQVTFFFVVQNVNDPPKITSNAPTQATEEQKYTYQLVVEELDKVDELTYLLTGPAGMNINSERLITWIPTSKQASAGSFDVSISVKDKEGAIDKQEFTIKIDNINHPPTITTTEIDDAVEDEEYTQEISAEDGDFEDVLAFTLLSPENSWLKLETLSDKSARLVGTPQNNDVTNSLVVKVKVSDGTKSEEKEYLIKVNNKNNPPEILSTTLDDAEEDKQFTFLIAATDPDMNTYEGDVLAYQVDGPEWLNINEKTGLLEGNPKNKDVERNAQVSVTVTDKAGLSTSKTFSLNVLNTNDKPVITTTELKEAQQDEEYKSSVDANDEDSNTPDGEKILYELTGPEWLSINANNGQLSGVPKNKDVGEYTISIKVTDSAGESDEKSYLLKVNNVNDPPEITSTPPSQAKQDDKYTYNVIAADKDLDLTLGEKLFFTIKGPEEMNINSEGKITWTPKNKDVGTHKVKIKVEDNLEQKNIVEQSFDLTVDNVNDLPEILTQTIPDATQDGNYEQVIDVADPDGDTLSFELLNPKNSWLKIEGSTLKGIPLNEHTTNNLLVKLKVSDGTESKEKEYTIKVVNENDAPKILNENNYLSTATEDSTYTEKITAQDPDQDTYEGDTLVYRITEGPDWLKINELTGEISGTPLNQHVETSTITILVEDSKGKTAKRTFSLDVKNVNDAPIITTGQGELTNAKQDVLYTTKIAASDEDELSDEEHKITYELTSPDWLHINKETGEISGTPLNQNAGENTFKVIAKDNKGATNEKTFTLLVENVNDAPKIESHPLLSAVQDQQYNYELLVNDDDLNLNVNEQVEISFIQKPEGMILEKTSANKAVLKWTPTQEDVKSKTVLVGIEVKDSSGLKDVQTFSIEIKNVNDLPVIETISIPNAKQKENYQSFIKAEDLDEDELKYSLKNNPSWLSVDSKTGVLSGLPDKQEFVGSSTLIVEVTDGTDTASKELTITVDDVNDLPQVSLESQSFEIKEDEEFSTRINVIDDDGDQTFTYALQPSNTWLKLSEERLTGIPSNSDVGTKAYNLEVSDEKGGVSKLQFSIKVNNVNDKPVLQEIPDFEIKQGEQFTQLLTAQDDDSLSEEHKLTYSLEGPEWLEINKNTGELSGTPLNKHVGETKVSVTVEDNAGEKDTKEFTAKVLNKNDPPKIISVPIVQSTQDALYEYSVKVEDEDLEITNEKISYKLEESPEQMKITDEGKIIWNPSNNAVGVHKVVVKAEDKEGLFDEQTYFLEVKNVNDAPIIETDSLPEGKQGEAYTTSIKASDLDKDELKFTLQGPEWLNIDEKIGILEGLPAKEENTGLIQLIVSVSDGTTKIDKEYTLNIENINDPPKITSQPITIDLQGLVYEYKIIAEDPDLGDELEFTLAKSPEGMQLQKISPREALLLPGSFERWPNTGKELPIEIIVSDGKLEIKQSFNLFIEPEYQPEILSKELPTGKREELYQFTIEATDKNENDKLYFIIVDKGRIEETKEVISELSRSVEISFIPGAKQEGRENTILAAVDDQVGAENSVNVKTFTIPITNEVNDPPAIEKQGEVWSVLKEATENEPLLMYKGTDNERISQIIVKDYDLNTVLGPLPPDKLSYNLEGPEGMKIKSIEEDEETALVNIEWVPTTEQAGKTFPIKFTITDSQGLSDSFETEIKVKQVNDQPIFLEKPSLEIAKEGQKYTYQVKAEDIDGDSLSYELLQAPEGMSIDRTGLISWIPSRSEAQKISHTITVLINDQKGFEEKTGANEKSTNTLTFNINVESLEVCGNNKKEAEEVCDGKDLGEKKSCGGVSPEFNSGVLSCKSDCSGYDLSKCYFVGSSQCDATHACSAGLVCELLPELFKDGTSRGKCVSQEGGECAGLSGIQCAKGNYCDMSITPPWVGNPSGQCTKEGEENHLKKKCGCSEIEEPVCRVGRITLKNKCVVECYGEKTYTEGKCGNDLQITELQFADTLERNPVPIKIILKDPSENIIGQWGLNKNKVKINLFFDNKLIEQLNAEQTKKTQDTEYFIETTIQNKDILAPGKHNIKAQIEYLPLGMDLTIKDDNPKNNVQEKTITITPTQPPARQVCGNGIKEAGEACEVSNDCPVLPGSLRSCSAFCECAYQTLCGNNVCDTSEGENKELCPTECETICPAVVDPVCGVDDKTYNNECEAGKAGVEIKQKGICPELVIPAPVKELSLGNIDLLFYRDPQTYLAYVPVNNLLDKDLSIKVKYKITKTINGQVVKEEIVDVKNPVPAKETRLINLIQHNNRIGLEHGFNYKFDLELLDKKTSKILTTTSQEFLLKDTRGPSAELLTPVETRSKELTQELGNVEMRFLWDPYMYEAFIPIKNTLTTKNSDFLIHYRILNGETGEVLRDRTVNFDKPLNAGETRMFQFLNNRISLIDSKVTRFEIELISRNNKIIGKTVQDFKIGPIKGDNPSDIPLTLTKKPVHSTQLELGLVQYKPFWGPTNLVASIQVKNTQEKSTNFFVHYKIKDAQTGELLKEKTWFQEDPILAGETKNIGYMSAKSERTDIEQPKILTEITLTNMKGELIAQTLQETDIQTLKSTIKEQPKIVCGNNKKEGDEVCDGTDLGGQTCESRNFFGGELKCTSTCNLFDLISCVEEKPDLEGKECAGLRGISCAEGYYCDTSVTPPWVDKPSGSCTKEGEESYLKKKCGCDEEEQPVCVRSITVINKCTALCYKEEVFTAGKCQFDVQITELQVPDTALERNLVPVKIILKDSFDNIIQYLGAQKYKVNIDLFFDNKLIEEINAVQAQKIQDNEYYIETLIRNKDILAPGTHTIKAQIIGPIEDNNIQNNVLEKTIKITPIEPPDKKIPVTCDTLIGDGLVLDASFDEGANIPGTIGGAPKIVKGGASKEAYDFDGVDDYVQLTSNPFGSAPEKFTYSFWIYPRNVGPPKINMLLDGYQDHGNTYGYGMGLQDGQVVAKTSKPILHLNYPRIGQGMPPLENNKWYHVAVTYDKNTKESKLYFNGELVREDKSSSTITQAVSPRIAGQIKSDRQNERYYDGLMDEFEMYNTLIDPTRIKEYYEKCKPAAAPPAKNEPPTFLSTPETKATEEVEYTYNVRAKDDDQDNLFFSLEEKPEGLRLEDNKDGTARVTWTPSNEQANKEHTVKIVIDDGKNEENSIAEQTFKINVKNINDAPEFTSTSPTSAQTLKEYYYAAEVKDEDGDEVKFKLLEKPNNMLILNLGDNKARITWTPNNEQGRPGSNIHTVILEADDGQNQDNSRKIQKFTVTVGEGNHQPVIISEPQVKAKEAVQYKYLISTKDEDNDELEFILETDAKELSLKDNKDGTAELIWKPKHEQANNKYKVKIIIDDKTGASNSRTEQEFQIFVEENNKPAFTSTPLLDAKEGETYLYPLTVEDADGDKLAVELVNAPEGMTLEEGKLIKWTPTREQLTAQKEHKVILKVDDKKGLESSTNTQEFTIITTLLPGYCGDNTCDTGEDSTTCPEDCPETPGEVPVCGNNKVELPEECETTNDCSDNEGFTKSCVECKCKYETAICPICPPLPSCPECGDKPEKVCNKKVEFGKPTSHEPKGQNYKVIQPIVNLLNEQLEVIIKWNIYGLNNNYLSTFTVLQTLEPRQELFLQTQNFGLWEPKQQVIETIAVDNTGNNVGYRLDKINVER